MYGLSDNGWIDIEIFENWFIHHLLVHAPCALSERTGLAFIIPLYSPARSKRPKFLPHATPAEESSFARPKIPPHRKPPPPEENLSARPKVPPHVKPPEERHFTV